VRIPLHRPCIRQTLPLRRFDHADAMFDAVVERVAMLQAKGRPVLVGTDNVADSQRVSERLGCHGIEHRVLNALQDADEAVIVAEAGRSGHVTVATRMAGRGTDIELDAAARAAGGLHVISCQDNASRRLDRQLAGRAGRQGDPGSTETCLLPRTSSPRGAGSVDTINAWTSSTTIDSSLWLALPQRRWIQWREERRRAAVRRHLLEQDLHWERRLSFAGPPS
jgi:preprotein translocase subunit SecA